MTFKYLDMSTTDFIANVRIDRPPVNALNRELVDELAGISQIIDEQVSDGKVRVVIFSSTGKYFSAGADLKERMEMSEEEVAPTVNNIQEAVNKLAKIKVPTIAIMQGSAMGGGFEVALAADIRVMAEDAKVGLRETALAIIPGAGGTQRLTHLVGPSNAILWITSARLFSAKEALSQGAVNDVVSKEELEATAFGIAKDIANNGPLAVQQAKAAILKGLEVPLKDALNYEFECYRKIIPTRDRVEGLNAFKEKRSPVYSGN